MLHAAPVSSRAIAMFCVEIEEAEHELVFLVWRGHQHLVVKCRYPSYSPNPISPKMTAEKPKSPSAFLEDSREEIITVIIAMLDAVHCGYEARDAASYPSPCPHLSQDSARSPEVNQATKQNSEGTSPEAMNLFVPADQHDLQTSSWFLRNDSEPSTEHLEKRILEIAQLTHSIHPHVGHRRSIDKLIGRKGGSTSRRAMSKLLFVTE
ncbi:hypothetical protein ACO22_03721 [Paracoccidioides brasiliensis]|uniref:Uncharacterized protein n=1 Tax=Paracoccidioides brasiliensis TaxID=121759 RepID=A0A1D2JFB9_PARBR|nr:hypothetical protein ACO22_03721 [Paracoccidioides brasiliensis]